QLAATLAALGEGTDVHNPAARADSDVAVGAVVGAGNNLRGGERSHLSQPGYLGAKRAHRTANVDDRPDLPFRSGNRGLVNEPEQSLFVRALAVAFRDSGNVRNHLEGEAAVSRQGNRQRVFHVEQVREEEVSVVVKRQARVATGVAEVVIVPDQL